MTTTRWIIILIVCAIYGLIQSPIEKAVKKRITDKRLRFLINFMIGVTILFALYTIADLLGYGIND